MEDSRTRVIGSATAVLGAVTTAAGVVAAVKGDVWLALVLFVVTGIAIFALLAVLVGDLFGWIRGGRRSLPELPVLPIQPQPQAEEPVEDPAPAAGPVFISQWRNTLDGIEANNVSRALQYNVSHPGLAKLGYSPEPAKVVLAALVACGPIDDALSTTELVRSFVDLLNTSVIGSLVSDVAEAGEGASWRPFRTNGKLNLQAALARSANTQEEVPVATAILNVNDSTPQIQPWSDPKRAELVLIIYPEAKGQPFQARSLEQWHEWFTRALMLPAGFSSFLVDEVHVPTFDDPTAQVGVTLHASGDLTQMVDVSEFQRSPGNLASRSFPMYLIADRAGKPPPAVAVDALRALCDHGLYVLGYEKQLDGLR